MEIMRTCACSEQECLRNGRFSVAYLESDTKIKEVHNHKYLEIYLSLSGGQRFMIDGSIYPMDDNNLFLINEHQLHYPGFLGSVHQRYVIAIMPSFLNSLSSSQTNLMKLFYHEDKSNRRISLTSYQKDLLINRLEALESLSGYGSDLLENSILIEIILFLQQVSLPSQYPLQATDNEYIQNMLTYINNYLEEDLSLDSLAAEFFLSKGYICRLFKEHMGVTVSKYISSQRIEAAKLLLITGYSVQETAFRCGFNDYSNFIRRFTNETGLSPSRYGKENRVHISV